MSHLKLSECFDEKGSIRQDALAQDPDMADVDIPTDVEDGIEDDLRDLKEAVGVIQQDLEVIKSLLRKYLGPSQGGQQDVLSNSIGMDQRRDHLTSESVSVCTTSSAPTMSGTPMHLSEPLTLSMSTPMSTPRSKCWVHPLELNVQRVPM